MVYGYMVCSIRYVYGVYLVNQYVLWLHIFPIFFITHIL